MRKKTIAETLDGKRLDEAQLAGSVVYNPTTGIFTFDDESQAFALILHEDVQAYVSASLSTMTKKPYKVWKAL
jgi:hypothetical protein